MKRFLEIKEELMKLSLPIGLMIVTGYPDYDIIFANEKLREMLGFTSEDGPLQAVRKSAWDCVYQEDAERLWAEAKKRNGEPEPYEISYRAVKKDGGLIWVSQCSQHVMDDNGHEMVYAYYTDITAQKQTEQALRESEARYAAAVRSANINIWEYDYATDTMDIFSTSPRANPKDGVILNYLETVVSEGHIREDCAPLLFDMIEKLKNGAQEVTADLWIRQNPDDDFWCERVIYINEFDRAGSPVKAYCVGRDITREKEAEKRYYDERSYREAMQKATIASINVNLTQNIILDYKSTFPEVTAHMEAAKTVQDYFEQVYTELATDEMRQQCMAVFHRDALLRQFANGKTTLSLELKRTFGGRRYWTVATAHMMKMENGDVVAFLYSTDITN
ncbi:MAG: PAS domain S-box protein, partial [Pseudoflavonifractor sp.]